MIKKDRDKDRKLKTTLNEITKKMEYFEEFVEHGRKVLLQGTDKYTGAKKDIAETIDLMPMMVGEQGFVDYILCDILKRLIRFRNERRERDLVKIFIWVYLLNSYLKNLERKKTKTPIIDEDKKQFIKGLEKSGMISLKTLEKLLKDLKGK